MKKLKELIKYLSYGIWHENLNDINKKKLRSVRFLRIIMLIGNGYTKDLCSLHASSLTFISLLSFVPVLTICFIFANAMGASEKLHVETKNFVRRIAEAPLPLEKEITKLTSASLDDDAPTQEENISVDELAGNTVDDSTSLNTKGLPLEFSPSIESKQDNTQQASESLPMIANESIEIKSDIQISDSYKNGVVTVDTIDRLIDVAFEKINGINFKALGIIGFIFFAWTVFGLLEKIELAFNSVWKQKKQRPIVKKLRDYSVILFIVPALGLLAFLIPLFNVLINHISKFDGGFFATLVDNPVTRFLMIAILLILAFAIIHKGVPYTKVHFKAALYGGLFTAIGFVIWFKLCLSFQIGVAKYSAAFGSFAMVPIILFWVYISWQIILFGAEITYAIQNWKEYKPSIDDEASN